MTFSFKKIFGLEPQPFTAESVEKLSVDQAKKKFFKSIRNNDQNAVGLIMDKHPNAMEWNRTTSWARYEFYSPLLEALDCKNYDMLSLMISKGADINMAVHEKENFPERLINRAITDKNVDAVAFLINEKADLQSYANTKNWVKTDKTACLKRQSVFTPLEQAQKMAAVADTMEARNTCALIVKMLEQAIAAENKIEAPVSSVDSKIQQAFFSAVESGRTNTVDLLLTQHPEAANWKQQGVSAFEKALTLSEENKADIAQSQNYLQIAESIAKVIKENKIRSKLSL